MEFKDELRCLKHFFNAFSNKELADKLEITESAIKGWTKRKTIPMKYKKYIEYDNKTNIKGNQNNITINNNNQNFSYNDFLFIELFKNLSEERKNHYVTMLQNEVITKNIINEDKYVIGEKYIIKAEKGSNKKNNNEIIILTRLEDHYMPNYGYGKKVSNGREIKIEPLNDLIKID